MSRSHYSIKKRRKEIARKAKQEQKMQRKLNKNSIQPEEDSFRIEEANAKELQTKEQDLQKI